MMSTAILLKVDAEPSAVNQVSADRVPDGISFAERLDATVRDGTLSHGGTSADNPATGLSSPKGAAVGERPDVLAAMRAAAGKKGVAGHRGLEPSDAKNSIAETIAAPRVTTATASQGKEVLDDPAAKDIEAPVQEERGDLSSGHDNPQSLQTDEFKDRGLAQIGTGKEDLSVIHSGSPGLVTKEKTTEPGRIDDAASAKKAVRSPEGGIPPKTAQKNIGLIESANTIQPKFDVANLPEGGVFPAGPAATLAAPRNDVDATTKGFSEVSSGTVASTAPAFAVSSGSTRGEAAHGAKAGASDVETTVTPVVASIASPKSSMGSEVSATSLSVGSDGDGKNQSGVVSIAGLSHVMLGGAEASSGSNPLVALHGSAQGDLIAAKSQAGDAVPHPSGLSNGMREQEGSVGVGTSIGEVPRMLASTPTSLEVGIQDGMHGWLKIRAEMAEGGMVNASVSTASATGQEMLHRELPALTAYLVEEKVAVNAVVVHVSQATGADARSSSGMDSAEGQTSQRSNEGEERKQGLGKAALSDLSEATTYRSLQGVDEDGSLPLAGYGIGGGWLSVRA
jgi:hypothetical protein